MNKTTKTCLVFLALLASGSGCAKTETPLPTVPFPENQTEPFFLANERCSKVAVPNALMVLPLGGTIIVHTDENETCHMSDRGWPTDSPMKNGAE